MPDTQPIRQGDASESLAEALRATVARFRRLREQEHAPAARRRIEGLLAEAEAALSELEIPEEW
jgi:hypothetical protein